MLLIGIMAVGLMPLTNQIITFNGRFQAFRRVLDKGVIDWKWQTL